MDESDRFIAYEGANLRKLLTRAYEIGALRIDAPAWITDDFFDISAKLPEGATKADIPAMLRQLLTSRFNLKVHMDRRKTPVFALTIGKDGPKLSACEVAQESGKERDARQLLAGPSASSSVCPRPRSVLRQSALLLVETDSVRDLSVRLSRGFDRPVVDRTGLNGNFRIAIEVTPPPDAFDRRDPSALFAEVQKLGLKLEPDIEEQEFLVVDNLDRAPSAN